MTETKHGNTLAFIASHSLNSRPWMTALITCDTLLSSAWMVPQNPSQKKHSGQKRKLT